MSDTSPGNRLALRGRHAAPSRPFIFNRYSTVAGYAERIPFAPRMSPGLCHGVDRLRGEIVAKMQTEWVPHQRNLVVFFGQGSVTALAPIVHLPSSSLVASCKGNITSRHYQSPSVFSALREPSDPRVRVQDPRAHPAEYVRPAMRLNHRMISPATSHCDFSSISSE